ncbi:MAG: prepilin-type N-terminal cleavage/methylation domain-containing protein [Candidatus Microsaccharimonas sp.]
MMQQNKSGFTLVELVIAFTIGSVLIATFYLLYITGVNVNAQISRRSLAQNIAYNSLLKYSESDSSTWSTPFVCSSINDTKTTPSAAGQTISTTTLTGYRLPAPATLTIKAFAPYGCDVSVSHMPIMIRASVTYGPDNLEEVYVAYSNK